MNEYRSAGPHDFLSLRSLSMAVDYLAGRAFPGPGVDIPTLYIYWNFCAGFSAHRFDWSFSQKLEVARKF
jgi:hypothetical protein